MWAVVALTSGAVISAVFLALCAALAASTRMDSSFFCDSPHKDLVHSLVLVGVLAIEKYL